MVAEPMFVEQTWDLEYRHAVGEAAQRFFEGLRRKVLLGSRCTSCSRVLVPPRGFCDECHEDVGDFVEVAQRGVLEAFTVVYAQFKNMPEPPYALGYVRPGGSDTALLGYVRDVDVRDRSRVSEALHVGMEMDVAFSNAPQGGVLDYWFTPPGGRDGA
jgi:uncharacterized protein